MRHRRRRVTSVVVAGMVLYLAFGQGATAAADLYPMKPVRVIVAQPAGGNADTQARLFATKLSERMGRQFVVDNRPGRNIAWSIVARAPADGYTLLAILPDFIYAPALYKNLPVDPIRDFAPLSLMTRTPYLLVVNPSLPAKSVKELITLANASPGKLNFGGGLLGTGTHLMSASFFSLANIKASYVSYKGAAQAVNEILAGQIDAGFATATAAFQVRSGKLRGLGISTATRSRLLPDVPTIAEQGVRGFDASAFHGWAAPAGTSAAIIGKLGTELAGIAKSPEMAGALSNDNSEPVGSTPEQFRQFIAAEIPRWRKLIRDSGISVDY